MIVLSWDDLRSHNPSDILFLFNHFDLDLDCFTASPSVCRDANGNPINDGQSIPSDDPCNVCVCSNGEPLCSEYICPPPPFGSEGCQPIYRPDECCPSYGHCFEPSLCRDEDGYPINEGLNLPDRSPCEVACVCSLGRAACVIVDCPFYSYGGCEPVYVEGQCCPSYDHCEVGTFRILLGYVMV